IFCSTVSGRLFPALAGRPVYVGHWSETPRANERMMETIGFFQDAGATSEERRAFLAERNVRYLYLGSIERGWGTADFDRDPLFRPIYRNAGAVLYEVQTSATVARHGSRVGQAVSLPAGDHSAGRLTVYPTRVPRPTPAGNG